MQPSKWITSLPIHRFHYVGFRCAGKIPHIPKISLSLMINLIYYFSVHNATETIIIGIYF